jgi:ferredoxin
MTVRCSFCPETVELRDAYQRITGWERKAVVASRKGGSDIVLRESCDEFACSACIARLRSGVNVEQGALL